MAYAFDPKTVEISFDLIPEGIYPIRISRAEESETKKGDTALLFDYVIDDGQQEGRHIFDTFLPEHPTAGKFSKENMKKLCDACGVQGWEDAGEMVGKKFVAKIKHKTQSDGQVRERIISYKNLSTYVKTKETLYSKVDDIAF